MPKTRLLLVFFVSLISNVIGCRFGYAIAHRQVGIVLMLGVMLPMMQAINSALFIEAQNRRERVWMAIAASCATATAGACVTLFLT
jgi:hypothetical protein